MSRWEGVYSKPNLTVHLQSQLSARDCWQGSWAGLQRRENTKYPASRVSLSSRSLQQPSHSCKHAQASKAVESRFCKGLL